MPLHRLSLALLILLPSGCSPSPDTSQRSASASPEESPDLESLRAIGYVQWGDAEGEQSGVTIHAAADAQAGYNLFTNDVDEAYLIDMEGKLRHTWKMPGKRQCEYVELLADGSILAVCVSQALLRIDWNSEPIWDLGASVHHDVAVRNDGSLLVPYNDRHHYRGRKVNFSCLGFLSAEGEMLNSWSTFPHLGDLQPLHAPSRLDTPPDEPPADDRSFDYYHLNSVEFLPETPLGARDPRFRAGNILVCLRNVDLLVILDADDLSVQWSWGPGTLDWPHHPTMLPDGNILVFDNGFHRDHSRVLEVEPTSGDIVWRYEATPPQDFYSKLRGSAQRLQNGNTLICESERGRVFEVTADGTIVWEFFSPEIVDGKRKRIYRFMRLPQELVEPLLETLGSR